MSKQFLTQLRCGPSARPATRKRLLHGLASATQLEMTNFADPQGDGLLTAGFCAPDGVKPPSVEKLKPMLSEKAAAFGLELVHLAVVEA